MTIIQLELEHFRCLAKAKLTFDAHHNLIVGTNGAGKTSILEAIYYLGAGHSFKSVTSEMLIQSGESAFLLHGEISDQFHIPAAFGVLGSRMGCEFRMNGRSLRSATEFVRRFPAQVIDPEVHRLLEDGPRRRRQFVDWGVFHVEHSFHEAWRRFNRALKQRNVALKEKSSTVKIWEADIAIYGTIVNDLRERYLNELRPFVAQLGRRLLDQNVDFDFYRGWKRDMELAEALKENRPRDLLRCSTGIGPHRAELTLKINGTPAKERVSRGQQKLLACVLMLGQQFHRVAIGAPKTCLLLDDPAAELDVHNLGRLLEVIADLPVQLVVTSLFSADLDFLKNAKLFHVEHGNVKAMA